MLITNKPIGAEIKIGEATVTIIEWRPEDRTIRLAIQAPASVKIDLGVEKRGFNRGMKQH